jgi:deoxyadenosine/deoxycytidine kinase
MKRHIIVAGNIGVGKSSLVELLCRRLGWQPFYEVVVDNPYLADFYADMPRWAFHSQIFFLANRLNLQRQIADHPTAVVQDRSIYEDAEVFARNLYEQGFISERDYATYRRLYTSLLDLLPTPDVVIYLRASVKTLHKRILQRGRDYESKITPVYLSQLNELYEQWIANFDLCPLLVVETDDLDFVAHPAHLDFIIDRLREHLPDSF